MELQKAIQHIQRNRTIYIIAGSVLVLGTACFILINRSNKKKDLKIINDILDGNVKDPNQGGGQVVISTADLNKLPIGYFPLKRGDKNQKVAALQKALNKAYGTSVSIDGTFGKETYDILCSKYFTLPCPPLSLGLSASRTISASNFEDINSMKATTT